MFQKQFLFLLFSVFACGPSFAQNLSGTVKDADTDLPLANVAVVVTGSGIVSATDADGRFEIKNVPCSRCVLNISLDGYSPESVTVSPNTTLPVPITVILKKTSVINEDKPVDIPTITIEEAEAENDGMGEVANLLHANRDVFQTLAGFGWFNFRFRERGYDAEHFPLYLNGVVINDPETGMAFFGEFGGLNDVLRSRESSIGLDATEFAFTEIGGATRIDTRASIQRKQIRASYAISNRSYRHRVMVTANTGLMPGGWAVSVSGSRRWAQEGYFEGSFFDGYSWFLSADKKFGEKHNLNFTVMGAPNKRGRVADSFQEMYDIAGTIRYNPNWGYQNGEKRNAAVSHSNQPIAMLRHDWTPRVGINWTTSAYYQGGENGITRLEWFNAVNPAPDYNRRLPSSYIDPVQGAAWAEMLRADESLRQLDWQGFYQTNRNSIETIEDAEGIQGNSISGKRSQYIIEDRRNDSRELGANTVFNSKLGDRFKLDAGVNYLWYLGENFKVMDDLLGGDFWVDNDKFAQQDFPDNPTAKFNDINHPNDIVRVGDVFGYNYDENIRRAGGWAQVTGDLSRVSFFGGAELNSMRFWRTGKMQNGRFPNSSLGDSEVLDYTTYGLKAGFTFKFNGRNYLYSNGFYGQRPPQFRDVFLSPRIRNEVVPNTRPYDIQSVEGGFVHRGPYLRARLTAYLTQLTGEYESATLFAQTVGVFGTQVLEGIDRRHQGIEAAVEAKPFLGWTFSGAANLGHYFYNSRPNLYVTIDNRAEEIFGGSTVYTQNFLVPRTPQTAFAVSAKYEGKKFWFASLTLNYADDIWYEIDETRRTAGFVQNFTPGSPVWNIVLDQQKAPAAYTLDFFGGKSWKIDDDKFLYFNAGINNILNNTNIIISGRDAYRSNYRDIDDVRLYTHEITYAMGLNYFISLALRM